MNLKEQLLSASVPAEVQPVSVAGLPTVYVRRLSWGELRDIQSNDDPARQVAHVLCDEQGSRLFSDDEARQLDRFPPVVLKAWLDAATEFNSLDAKVTAAKNVSGTVLSSCS